MEPLFPHDPDLARDNRERYLAQLSETGAAALIPTHTAKVRSNDSDFRFRPGSDFFWLTGFPEPEAWLVLLPEGPGGKGEGPRTVLFLRPRDAQRETWDGRRLGVERAAEHLGVDEARDVASLWKDLPALLAGYPRVVWRLGEEPERDARVASLVAGLRRAARGGARGFRELVDPGAGLHELRLQKSPRELDLMRRAARITADAHRAAMGATAPGKHEYEIEALIDHHYRSHGSEGPAYGNIVAGGANACILHYVENDRPLADGDLLLVDSGAEWRHYAADITRTWPVNGSFSEDQAAIYRVVLEALEAATDAVRPGGRFDDIHGAALQRIASGLVELGLVEGPVEKAIEEGTYRTFFMHKTSHWLGLDVHDVGLYQDPDGTSRTLAEGMVLTVEPGIYVPEDADVDPRWRGIGVRIEDDVLVTGDGHEVLTESCPKTIEDVEAACRGSAAVTSGA